MIWKVILSLLHQGSFLGFKGRWNNWCACNQCRMLLHIHMGTSVGSWIGRWILGFIGLLPKGILQMNHEPFPSHIHQIIINMVGSVHSSSLPIWFPMGVNAQNSKHNITGTCLQSRHMTYVGHSHSHYPVILDHCSIISWYHWGIRCHFTSLNCSKPSINKRMDSDISSL